MTTESKLRTLERILIARLEFINRWNDVKVIQSGNSFIIEWSKPKRGNIHPIETKEIPIADIDLLIERNVTRLKNETKTYK